MTRQLVKPNTALSTIRHSGSSICLSGSC